MNTPNVLTGNEEGNKNRRSRQFLRQPRKYITFLLKFEIIG